MGPTEGLEQESPQQALVAPRYFTAHGLGVQGVQGVEALHQAWTHLQAQPLQQGVLTALLQSAPHSWQCSSEAGPWGGQGVRDGGRPWGVREAPTGDSAAGAGGWTGTWSRTRSVTAVGVPQSTAQHRRDLTTYCTAHRRHAWGGSCRHRGCRMAHRGSSWMLCTPPLSGPPFTSRASQKRMFPNKACLAFKTR